MSKIVVQEIAIDNYPRLEAVKSAHVAGWYIDLYLYELEYQTEKL